MKIRNIFDAFCGEDKEIKDAVDRLAGAPIEILSETSDKCMEVYRLLKTKDYKKAESVLMVYLTEQIGYYTSFKEQIKSVGKNSISKPAAEKIIKTIDEKLKELYGCINEHSSK